MACAIVKRSDENLSERLYSALRLRRAWVVHTLTEGTHFHVQTMLCSCQLNLDHLGACCDMAWFMHGTTHALTCC